MGGLWQVRTTPLSTGDFRVEDSAGSWDADGYLIQA